VIKIKLKMLSNAVFWISLLIFCFSRLKYTYHYNYRSHISLQVVKLAKSAGVQILIFPTVCIGTSRAMLLSQYMYWYKQGRAYITIYVWVQAGQCLYHNICIGTSRAVLVPIHTVAKQ